MDLISRWG